ncbi:MAG: sulfite exporter TauE/SafE family protein [Clostridia bacterium]|nr:sulfite exporter TauE/SafE family protein [Clostridia bacterium]
MIHHPSKIAKSPSPWILCALTGLGAGLLNGLLGAAGGILLVVALPRITPPPLLYPPSLPLGTYHERRDILATALAVMLPISAVSGAFYWLGGIRPSPTLLLALIIPAAAGGLVGAKLLTKLPNHLLKKIFAAIVVIAGVRMLF